MRLFMRRCLSTLLLLAFCAGLALPFMLAQPSLLPACCARGGKHHCNMAAMGAIPGRDGFKSAPEACPYRHCAVLASVLSALTVPRHRTAILVLLSQSLQPNAVAFDSIHHRDAHKRGPPTA